jgi:ABC-type nickel/cobalt efflux system permease component RcnA
MTPLRPSRLRTVALAATAATTALVVLLPGVASAHPLGNFTINHWSEVRVEPGAVVVDHVIDLAEIPTFAAFRAVDADGDGTASAGERSAAATARCADQAAGLSLTIAGEAVPLRSTAGSVSFPAGQGAPTMRLVCRLEATVPGGVAGPVTFGDGTFAERAGWREIVVRGDRMTVSGAVAAAGRSDRLTAYPEGLLAQPLQVASVAFTVTAGGPALPPLVQPELGAGPTADDAAMAAVPGGITELGGELAGLFQAQDLTLPVVVLSLLAAAALGALHALSPGHGKTVMAAYLVGSRGTARQALGLGTAVTVSHTLGVLALGALSVSAAAIIPPERLYPILGIVSGAIVVAIAGWLLLGIIRGWRATRVAAAAHAHAHATGADHHHHHADHDHDHGHAPEGGTGGWHRHGGVRHTHAPTTDETLRWKGLFALGLAGGMVPSVSAIILLLGSIAAGRPAYGIGLTIAFGLGMAAVLVGIGVGLVYARGLLERLPDRVSGRRLGRLVPAGSATVMLAAGLLIVAQAALTVP